MGYLPGTSLILWFYGWCFGRVLKPFSFRKRCNHSWYSFGIFKRWSSLFLLLALLVRFSTWRYLRDRSRVLRYRCRFSRKIRSATFLSSGLVFFLEFRDNMLTHAHLFIIIVTVFQSTEGLWNRNQGIPKTTSWLAISTMLRISSSSCPWILRVRRSV